MDQQPAPVQPAPPVPVTPAPTPVPTPASPSSGQLRRGQVIFLILLLAISAYEIFAVNARVWPHAASATLTPLPNLAVSPTPISDSTSDWKTYTNTTIGYEIQYPQEWTVSEKSGEVLIVLAGSHPPTDSRTVRIAWSNRSLATTVTQVKAAAKEVLSETITTFAGKGVTHLMTNDGTGGPDQELVFGLGTQSSLRITTKLNDAVALKILSTFTFTK